MLARRIKIGLLVLGLVLTAYVVYLWLDKRAQWAAFLQLEQEQLAIVTADGFIEREFGVDTNYRVQVLAVDTYLEFLSDAIQGREDIERDGIEAVQSFLDNAPEPVIKGFTLVFSDKKEMERYTLAYPVSWCEVAYCDFNLSLIEKLEARPFPISQSTLHSNSAQINDYKFVINYNLTSSSDGSVWGFTVSIGSEPRNFWDNVMAALIQSQSGYSFKIIYYVDFVTGWEFYRGELQSG